MSRCLIIKDAESASIRRFAMFVRQFLLRLEAKMMVALSDSVIWQRPDTIW